MFMMSNFDLLPILSRWFRQGPLSLPLPFQHVGLIVGQLFLQSRKDVVFLDEKEKDQRTCQN
jgi:hypothetical protein